MQIPRSLVVVEDDPVMLKRLDDHVDGAFPGCNQRVTKDVDRVLEEPGFLDEVDLLMVNIELFDAEQCNELVVLAANLDLSPRCVFMYLDAERYREIAELMTSTTGGLALHKDAQAEEFFSAINAHLDALPPTPPTELEAAAELPQEEEVEIGEPMGG